MKKRIIQSVSILLVFLTVISCFSVAASAATENTALALGDVDGNGTVNIADCTHLQKYLAGLLQLTDEELAASDTNGDGKINISDVTKIQKVLAGLESFTENPAGKTYTRGEWVEFIVNKCELKRVTIDSEEDYHFIDIADSKYAEAIETAFSFNILPAAAGYSYSEDPDSYYFGGSQLAHPIMKFEPDAVATREFAAVTVYNVMGFKGSLPYDFADEDEMQYTACAETMINQGFMTAVNKCFNPQNPVSEADKNMISERIDYFNNRSDIDESETKSDIEYKDNVKTISETPVIKETNEEKFIVSFPKTNETAALAEGSVFVASSNESGNACNVLKVAEVLPESDNSVNLLCTMPEMNELFESADVVGVTKTGFDGIEPVEGVTITTVSNATGDNQSGKTPDPVGAEESKQYEFDLDFSKLMKEDSIEFGPVKLTFRIKDPVVTCKTRVVHDGKNLKDLMLSIEKNFAVSYDVGISEGMSTADVGKKLEIPDLKIAALPAIYISGTPFFVAPQIFAYFDFYGKLSLGVKFVAESGVEVVNYQPRVIQDWRIEEPSLTLIGSAQVGLGVRVLLGVGNYYFAHIRMAGFDIKAGPAITATITTHLDVRPYLNCFDVDIYFAVTLSLTEDTVLYELLNALHTKFVWYIYNANNSRWKYNLHCESGGDTVDVDFEDRACTYNGGSGDMHVSMNKDGDANKQMTLDLVRLYDEHGNFVNAYRNCGYNYFLDSIPAGAYHVEVLSTDARGDLYLGAQDVTVTKNNTAECVLSGRLLSYNNKNKGSIKVDCISDASGNVLTSGKISLYDENENLVRQSNIGNNNVFRNLAKGKYYVSATSKEDNKDISGSSEMIIVDSDETKSCVVFLSSAKDGNDDKKDDEKRDSQDFTVKPLNLDFDDPFYTFYLLDEPYVEGSGKEYGYTYSFIPDGDGWYHNGGLYDNPYITNPGISAGTYYMAICVQDRNNPDNKVWINAGSKTLTEKRAFRISYNPSLGHLTVNTYIPIITVIL